MDVTPAWARRVPRLCPPYALFLSAALINNAHKMIEKSAWPEPRLRSSTRRRRYRIFRVDKAPMHLHDHRV